MTGFPINPPNTPLVDPRSGLITREWYRFFRDIQKTIGGEASPFDDSNFLAPPGITTATGGASDADALAPPLAPLAVDDPLLPPLAAPEVADPLIPPTNVPERDDPLTPPVYVPERDDPLAPYAPPQAAALIRPAAEINAATADPTSPFVLVEEFVSGTTETGEVGTHNWTFTAGSMSLIAGVASHPGTFRFTSSNVNGTVASVTLSHMTTSAPIASLADVSEFWWIFREQTAAISDVDMRIGMMQSVTAAPAPGWIGLEKLAADTNWFFVTRASSVQTRTDTGVAAGTTGWLKLRFRKVAAADWRLSINGAAEISNTTNIPTAIVQPAVMSVVSGGVSRGMELDFFSMVTPALSR